MECLLCGGPSELRHGAYPGYQEPDIFQIYHCPGCYTAFSLPRPSTEAIYQHIYANGSKVPGYDRYWHYVRTVREQEHPLAYLAEQEPAYWSVTQALPPPQTAGKPTTVLEVGSGLGYLTYSLSRAGFAAFGLDISEPAVKEARQRFGDLYVQGDLTDYAQLHAERFDVVVSTEVIEHIDKPLDFVGRMKQLLKPGGRVIITTPNKSFFPDDLVWSCDLPPVHCWWFGEESMRYIAQSADMSVRFVSFTEYYKRHYSGACWSTLRNNPLPCPCLERNGELLTQAAALRPKSRFNALISRVPYALRAYGRVREIWCSDFVVCREKGPWQCAILERCGDRPG